MRSTSMCWCVLFAFALGYVYSNNTDLDCICMVEDSGLSTCMCDVFIFSCNCTSDSCNNSISVENISCNCTSENISCNYGCDCTSDSCNGSTYENVSCNCGNDSSSCTPATTAASTTDVTTATATDITPTTATSPSSDSGILDRPTLEDIDLPLYLGIGAGGAFLVIILIFVCICICTVCIIKGSKSTKTKKLDDSAVRLSEEGKVQLLSIAEKAGVEDTDTHCIPEAVQEEQSPAETAADPKEDDKRVVTVATFGFPEVSILPPPTTEEENGAEAKKDAAEKKKVQKDNKEEGTSADSSGPGTPATTKETRVKTPEAKDVLDQAVNLEKDEVGMELVTEDAKVTTTSHAAESSPQTMDDAKTDTASLPKMDTAQVSLPKTDEISLPIANEVVELESVSNPSQQHDLKLGVQQFEMGPGMESLILSQEAIEKALP